MIFENIAWSFFHFLESLLNFTIAPFEGMAQIVGYIHTIASVGIGIFKFFFPGYVQALLLLCFGAQIAVDLYFSVVWILKKIPMANIS